MKRTTTIDSHLVTRSAVTALCCMTLIATGQSARAGGSPSVSQDGRTLFVDGTDAGDQLVIHCSGFETVSGEVEVWDVSVSPGVVVGTYSGVHDIDVELLGGDNFLGLYRFEVFGDVTVAAGNGNNQVHLGGIVGAPGGRTTIYGSFSVTTDAGFDEIRLEQCEIGDVMIDAGDGDNQVLLGHRLQPGLDAYHVTRIDQLSVTTGDGSDLVAMLGSEFDRFECSTIETGNGNDWVLIGAGYEDGDWTVRGNELPQLSVSTGDGADLVTLLDNEAYGGITIATGNHSDEVLLGDFGAPNDFQADVAANGGGGDDELRDGPNLYAVPPGFSSFETSKR